MQKFLLSVFLGILSVSGFSQEFEGGFLGGLTASQIDGDLFSGYNKVGITAGAYTTRKINSSVNWKLEIRYTQKGSYQKYTEKLDILQMKEQELDLLLTLTEFGVDILAKEQKQLFLQKLMLKFP